MICPMDAEMGEGKLEEVCGDDEASALRKLLLGLHQNSELGPLTK